MNDFEASRSWTWKHSRRTYGKYILAQYNLMQAVKQHIIADIDVAEILTDCAQDGVELSQRRLGHYALIPLETNEYSVYYDGGYVKGWSNDITETLVYSMWLDTPIGFALTYKGLPNAMAGVAMRGMDELMAYQLQGACLTSPSPEHSLALDLPRKQGSVG